jgi:hypothetical protein
MSQLSQPSIRYVQDSRYWAGAIEMFHNLHCLHHLQMHVWAEQPEVFFGRDPTKDEGAAHIGMLESRLRYRCFRDSLTPVACDRPLHRSHTPGTHVPGVDRHHHVPQGRQGPHGPQFQRPACVQKVRADCRLGKNTQSMEHDTRRRRRR